MGRSIQSMAVEEVSSSPQRRGVFFREIGSISIQIHLQGGYRWRLFLA